MNRIRMAWYALRTGSMPATTSAQPPTAPAGQVPSVEEPVGQGLPATAMRLIELRDHVLLAAAQPDAAPALAQIAQHLADILRVEGVEEIDDSGPFDPGRQRVVDTLQTADPEMDHHIASTVRPGYLAGNRTLRLQDVLVYRHSSGA